MRITHYVQLEVYTKNTKMTEPSYGQALLEGLGDETSLLYPEAWCVSLDSRVKPAYPGHEAVLGEWAKNIDYYLDGVYEFSSPRDFSWLRRKRKLRSHGWVKHAAPYARKANMQNSILSGCVDFKAELSYKVDWWTLLVKWSHLLTPYLGMLHPYPQIEQDYLRAKYILAGGYESTHLADVPWALCVGGHFYDEINPEELRELGFFVDSTPHNHIVRVTEHIEDVENNHAYFCQQQEKLRAVLGEKLFIDPSA